MKLNCCFMSIKTSSTRKTSSAQIVASIDDLLTEIFLRLPWKSLIRFKSVSKHWNSIISDPRFQFSRNLEPNPAVGLICRNKIDIGSAYVVPFDKSTNPAFRKLNFVKESSWPWGMEIMNSCNGLFVCGNYSDDHDHIQSYYVCNPTTMKYTTLPKLDVVLMGPKKIHWMYLAFDPSKSPHYKVVCVLGSGSRRGYASHEYQFGVYSSETGSWKKHGEHFTAKVYFEAGGVYWNGAIHWIVIEFAESTNKLIYLNPDDEHHVPQVMPRLPIVYGLYWTRNCYLGESYDHLHYVVRIRTACTVYEMEKDYSEWFVKYRVDLPSAIRYSFPICTLVRGKKDEDSFLIFGDKTRRRIIRYNLVRETFEILHEMEYSWSRAPLPYIECLCSV